MTALAAKQHLVAKVAARKSGADVTFTLTSAGTHDQLTDTYSGGGTTTVVGYATRVAGDPERYKALKLIESESPTLDFVPDTIGELPPQNASVTFGGVPFTVRDVKPWAPGGVAISALIVVTR